ncbi:MAG: sugar phosphate nucleotidyltransferase [Thermoanaerobacterales bacterium]|nr:sugar phosphate nucleotidyltransferase [Thermoanaerobacterales bacterium]
MTQCGSENLVAVIIAGGAGTRFWPLSTREKPKQFLSLFGEESLLQATYRRIATLVPPDRTLVLTGARFVSLAREHLPVVPVENVIGEPMRRDTAAAVALAAALCRRRFGNPVMAVLPADHVIEPAGAFQRAVLSAARGAVASGALYTFGIKPDYPATGYGYLELGEKVGEDDGLAHFRLVRFKEKPDYETARAYLRKGTFLWNSGIFVWTAEAIGAEIERHLPHHYLYFRELARHDGTPRWAGEMRRVFAAVPAVSVDYGVMEKAADVRVIAAPFSWSDVGGWPALEAFLAKDGEGNAARGRVRALDARGNLVYAEDPEELVALVGVEDLIVVRAGRKTLIASRRRAEEIKKLVENL